MKIKNQTVLSGNLILNGKDTGYKFLEWTDQQVKDFWEYENLFVENYFTYQVGKQVADYIKAHSFGRNEILDYGTGLGFLMHELLEANFQVTGLEFTQDSINKVKHKFGDYNNFLECYSPDQLLYTQKYPIVSLIEVIEHLNDHYLDLTFETIKNIISPDGLIFITTPNDEKLFEKLIFNPETKKVFHRWQHIRNWNQENIREYLEYKGFNIVKTETLNFSEYKSPREKSKLSWYIRLKTKFGFTKEVTKSFTVPHLVAIATLK